MATTNAERVAKSDAKRGIKLKAFKLPLEVIEEIEQISQQLEKNRTQKVRYFFKKYLLLLYKPI